MAKGDKDPLPIRNLALPFAVSVNTCRNQRCGVYFAVRQIQPANDLEAAQWQTVPAKVCPLCGIATSTKPLR